MMLAWGCVSPLLPLSHKPWLKNEAWLLKHFCMSAFRMNVLSATAFVYGQAARQSTKNTVFPSLELSPEPEMFLSLENCHI